MGTLGKQIPLGLSVAGSSFGEIQKERVVSTETYRLLLGQFRTCYRGAENV